jgi:predicted PurR-regulated permease PerM
VPDPAAPETPRSPTGPISLDSHSSEVVHVGMTWTSAGRIAAGIFLAYFAVQLVTSISGTFTRLVLGLVFAFALDPVVTKLQRRLDCKRGLAVALVGLLALGSFSALVILVGPSAVRQAATSSRDLPATVDKLSTLPLIGDALERADASTRIREWVANVPEQINDQAISNFVEALIGGLTSGLTVVLLGVAVLLDGPSLVRRLRSLVPRDRREHADMVGRIFQRTIGAYFAGSLLVASIAATFVLVVGLSLDVPLTPVAALWVLIVNFIPQIGGALAMGMFTILALGRGPGTALACLLLYWVYMFIENHVLQPIIVGNAVDLSAAATMLAALIGGASMGVPGAILATPLVGTVKALYMELKDPGSATRKPRHRALKHLIERVKTLRK